MYWRPLTFCLNWNVLKIISLRELEWFCTCRKAVERQLKKGDGSICNNVNATGNTEISPIACTVETPRSTLAVAIANAIAKQQVIVVAIASPIAHSKGCTQNPISKDAEG